MLQLDALKELTNIGSAHAATALSQMLMTDVNLSVPEVKIIPLQSIGDLAEDPSALVAAVYLKVLGDIAGKALFMFSPESARGIVSLLGGNPGAELYQDELALSALKEVGNILMGSFLTALTRFTELNLTFSVPAIAVDMSGAILDSVMMDGGYGDDWVFINTRFVGNEVEGTLAFLPDLGSLQTLLEALGL